MLVLLMGYRSMQKQGGKKDVVGPAYFGSFKEVLALLTKAVAVQVGISVIDIRKPGFQKLLLKLYLDQSGSLILVHQIGFHKLLE